MNSLTCTRRFNRLTMKSTQIQFYCLDRGSNCSISSGFIVRGKPLRHEGAGHFDWIHPGTDAFSTILLVLLK